MTKNVSAWLHFNENCEDFILECYNHSIMNKTSVTVFSTESGRHCPNCGMPVSECACKPAGANSPQWKDDVIRVRREKQGRNGKEVTTVRNFPGTTDELRRHATALKKALGTGGSEKYGTLEIQGDHVDRVIAYFKNINMKIKKDGG